MVWYTGFAPFHEGITCDGCRTCPIYGPRYKCRECDNFDLCEECFSFDNFIGSHDRRHTVRVIQCQLDQLAGNWYEEVCASCASSHYDGKQYECTKCKSCLCELCWALTERPFFAIGSSGCSHDFKMWGNHTRSASWTNDEYKAAAIKMQNHFAHTLGTRDYDEMDTDEEEKWKNLGRKIGYALFNEPTREGGHFGYDDAKEKEIIALRNIILELNREKVSYKSEKEIIKISFIFVAFYHSKRVNMASCSSPDQTVLNRQMPLARLHAGGRRYFIEPNGRYYDSWDDYTNHNKLPECWMCVPSGGAYEPLENRSCSLSFIQSAQCHTSRQLAEVGDVGATVGGVAATGLAVASIFLPVLLPATLITGAVIGSYGAGRSTYNLIDRGTHGESVNPFASKEAFFNWLSIVGAGFSFGSMGAIAYASRIGAAGGTLGMTAKVAVNVAIFGSLGISGVSIIANEVNILHKINNKEEITVLEVFQFTSSILFFVNACVNVQTAQGIFKTAQENVLAAHRTGLTHGERKNFDRALQKNRSSTGSQSGGNQITIRQLNEALAEQGSIKSLFAKNTNPLSSSAQRHTAEPGSITIDGSDLAPRQAALRSAKIAMRSRFGGNQAARGKESETTVMFKPSHEFDAEFRKMYNDQRLQGRQTMSLDKPVYAYNVKIDPVTGKHQMIKVVVNKPTFVVNDGAPVHFVGGQSDITPVTAFPKAFTLKVTPNEIPMTVAPANYKHEYDNESSYREYEGESD